MNYVVVTLYNKRIPLFSPFNFKSDINNCILFIYIFLLLLLLLSEFFLCDFHKHRTFIQSSQVCSSILLSSICFFFHPFVYSLRYRLIVNYNVLWWTPLSRDKTWFIERMEAKCLWAMKLLYLTYTAFFNFPFFMYRK